MRRLWELIIILIIGGLLLKWFIEAIEPLAPYMVGAVVIALVILVVLKILDRYRSW